LDYQKTIPLKNGGRVPDQKPGVALPFSKARTGRKKVGVLGVWLCLEKGRQGIENKQRGGDEKV